MLGMYTGIVLTNRDEAGNASDIALKSVPLASKSRNEAWLRDFLLARPSVLPTVAIDPAYAEPIPVCRELRTPSSWTARRASRRRHRRDPARSQSDADYAEGWRRHHTLFHHVARLVARLARDMRAHGCWNAMRAEILTDQRGPQRVAMKRRPFLAGAAAGRADDYSGPQCDKASIAARASNVFAAPQCSTITPSLTRSMFTPSITMRLFVGLIPCYVPAWGPRAVTRLTTRSSSAICCSTVTWRSG
jgi:hypothetical protein